MPKLETTAGQVLVNSLLPEDLRDYSRTLDKKGVAALLRQVAERYPEKYRDISHRMGQLGWRSAYLTGGNSFSIAHVRKAKAAQELQNKLMAKLQAVIDDDKLTDKQREELIIRYSGEAQGKIQDAVLKESLDENNQLALQLKGAGRGNPTSLASIRAGDLLYTDHHGNIIPVPVLRSYSEGLRPSEYWAGTYGARKGVLDTKFATQDAGFFGKQLNQITHRLVVTDLDGDGEPDTPRGLPVDTDDNDNEGALLAQQFGPYKRNTVLTPKILRHIKELGHNQILVRSPMVYGSPDGGVYARDVGVRERGGLPAIGELPGMTAAQALSEPLSQGMLSSKHSGGVAGAAATTGGFEYINNLIQVPKTFKGAAAHTEVDGRVDHIEPAPAGGYHVKVQGHDHYVPQGYGLKIKVGDEVEAGDVLSEGMPNPALVVKHKGIGEGRRYFVKAFRDAFNDAGVKAHRRNIELLARGLINHVRLTDEFGEAVPEDVLPYNLIEANYDPREDSQDLEPRQAVGQYLEKPYLHYTIGTKIRPSMLPVMSSMGVNQVKVHKNPPPFEPEMIRGMESLSHDPEWMTRMLGSGLKSSLLEATRRGSTSNAEGTSYVPGLAKAVDFGHVGVLKPPGKPFSVLSQQSVIGPITDSDVAERPTL